MGLIFTNHAKERMSERGIKIEDVQEIIDMPDYTIKKDGKVEAYKKINSQNFKIVYENKGKFIKIITVIKR